MTVELGVGAHRVLSVDGRGRVVAVYRRAAYLRLPTGLVVLTTPEVGRGPLHVRSPVRPGLLAAGDPVEVVAGRHLRIAPAAAAPADTLSEVDLAGDRVWCGRLPDPAALASSKSPAGLAGGVFCAAPPSALLDPVFAGRLAVAHDRLAHDDLAGTARALGGLGPGLTPSGDDALAGILLVARALGGATVEARLVAVARTVRTTSVARAFLQWAARGQCVEPAHDLLVALATPDAGAAALHLRALVGLGHTSGADLAYGIGLGLGVRVALVSSA